MSTTNNLDEKIRNLERSLKAGTYREPTVASLKIEPIDTSGWEEFHEVGGGSFFERPDIKSTIYQSGAPMNLVLDCSYFSIISSDKQKAINALRRDLAYIKNLWPKIKVVGFLAKPSLFEIITAPKPHEMADATMYTDLSGPKPGKKKWAAFCFLFAYEPTSYSYESGVVGHRPLTPARWKEWGLPSAVREGEVGQELPDTDQLFMSVATDNAKLNPIKVKGEPIFMDHPKSDFDPLKDESLGWGGVHGEWEDIDVSDLEPQMASTEIEFEKQPYHDQKLSTLTASGETKAAKVIGALHPEIQAAADKHGIDLSAPPGRELQEMRKFFGNGSGLYMASVDFQTARVSSTLLTEEAQKRILKALQPKLVPNKPKRKTKKTIKRLTQRRRSR